MTRHSALDETAAEVVAGSATGQAPERADALRVLARAHLSRGELAEALEVAGRILESQPSAGVDALEVTTDFALQSDLLQVARTLVCDAEARGGLAPWRAAQIKARIAMRDGDMPAARAILVMAIEAWPENAALRAQLAEAMVASGTAADVRAVLSHIGAPPVNPPAQEAETVPTTAEDPGRGKTA